MPGSRPVNGVVETTSGRVAGRRSDGCWSFLGIPYGAPTGGPARWAPPGPPHPWRGIRPATEPGAIAPQPPPAPGASLPGEPQRQSEDCLNLNVWTPALDVGRRPVMVWIHGGGFTSGTGASPLYRGEVLARRGDVVVVTCNYRLGALGFLCDDALRTDSEPGTGNVGLLDQLAVLRWVQEHAASFGGDPANVTVFGESAGGMSVSALVSMPSARGLFRRAIIESGPPWVHDRDRAAKAARELARRVGLERLSRQALESVPAAALIEAQQLMQAATPAPGELPLPFLPTVDGVVLPMHPEHAVAEGAATGIEIVAGTNRDEMTFFGVGVPRLRHIDEEGLVRWVARSAPATDPVRAVESYREIRAARGEATSPWDLWVALGSDIVFRAPTWRLANTHAAAGGSSRVYLFSWTTPILGGALGSCHALEIPFVFGCYGEPAVSAFVGGDQPGAALLSEAMQGAWAAFARDGDPSHPAIGDWERWEDGRWPIMHFERGGRLELGPGAEELDVWADSSQLTAIPPAGASAVGARAGPGQALGAGPEPSGRSGSGGPPGTTGLSGARDLSGPTGT